MRYALYQNFYKTLKRFVEDENFVIEYEILGNMYVLTFDKKEEKFCLKYQNDVILKAEDVYKIIKDYVINLIDKKQKEAFSGTFEKIKCNKIIFFNEDDKRIFCNLVLEFKPFLWEEPISPYDIEVNHSFKRIEYGFYDLPDLWWALEYLFIKIQKYPKSFRNGVIDYYMWMGHYVSEKEYVDALKRLQKSGYLILQEDKKKHNYYAIAFTEKFYDALKRTFYYDFDLQNLDINEVNKIIKFENI